MPYTNFPFYIRPATYEVPDDHIDYSVLFFESGDSSFIAVAKSQDVNSLTQLAAGLSNQTGMVWDGKVKTAELYNRHVRAAKAFIWAKSRTT